MAIQVVHRDDINLQGGLTISAANKLEAKVDNTTVKINDAGELEAILGHDVKLSGIDYDATTQELTFTLDDGSAEGTALPPVSLADLVDVDTNTYVVSGTVNGQVINLTMSDDSVVPVDLEPVVTAFKTSITGEELQSLGGVTLGKLLKT